MEADISIWQKPGHFYFALTRIRQRTSSGEIVGSNCELLTKAPTVH
jgi:hypothetical protein